LNRLTKNASKRIGSLSFKKILIPSLQNCPRRCSIRISFQAGCQQIKVWQDFLGGEVIVAKARFDPEKCQKERFALPLAIFLVRRLCGGVADWQAC